MSGIAVLSAALAQPAPKTLTAQGLGPHPVTFSRASQAWDETQTSENLTAYSEPASLAEIATKSGVTVGASGVAFGDNSVQRYAYVSASIAPTTAYLIAARVRMDDGNAPAPSDLSTAGDFCLVIDGQRCSGHQVQALTGGEYLVTATRTTGASVALVSGGALKYTSQSARAFTVTKFQIERAASPGSYLRTSGRAIPRYHVDNDTPRVRVVGGYPVWTIEPQRTNLITKADPTALADFTVTNITALAPAASIAPYLNGGYSFGDNSAQRDVRQTPALAVSTQYCLSVRVRMDDGNAPVVGINNSSGDFALVLANAIVTTPATVTRLPGGEYLVWSVATTGASIANFNTGIWKYLGQSARTFKVSGFQVEAGAFPTSLILTSGAAATRAADVPVIAASVGDARDRTWLVAFKPDAIVPTGWNRLFYRGSVTTDLESVYINNSTSIPVFQFNGANNTTNATQALGGAVAAGVWDSFAGRLTGSGATGFRGGAATGTVAAGRPYASGLTYSVGSVGGPDPACGQLILLHAPRALTDKQVGRETAKLRQALAAAGEPIAGGWS